ncbi:juvenile hormone esterase-like isoform X2 [Spodoptera litura]|uniref:Carboxylic ester hydrolase n=1 Tax=Spodoptera litura TaxID=69820 RepID=A0A9J7E1A5_SPOLT|nr:juvenile hormone esterase-like isoform X2 [Spodoptera litura]XP_022822429.1 juvenile hormone esterase-like isoform X2 [Spodoptera litura]XP_022822438.1 juvenile hormone esterase-like isoform X2 [Spodoptera litura]XP_022822447.1 juvenile hormone esterase-like isoform X2 [Spodoptera litura]
MQWQTCVLLLCVTAILADDEWREVKTSQGVVRGRKHPTEDIYTFYNIPYATAPVGVDKFKAPLPPPVWLEAYEAVDKQVICPQPALPFEDLEIKNELPLVKQENCLIANVYVPNTNKKNLSVVVYVHGGGFITGWGELFKATQLLKKKDIIVVTFNYRLGVHGFLCLGTEDAPGNAGMKDQVALLRWVQKNIASFGGNADDVTIIGYSAGSASVDLLMLSKSTEGLFHRVVPESGGNLAAFAIQRDPVEIAKTFARQLNFTNVDDIYALGEFYKTAPLELLTSDPFIDRTDSTLMFSPCVERNIGEETFLTESPLTILKNGKYKKLPMLYGFANMEGLFRINFFPSWKQKMNDKFSDFLPADLRFESEEEREEVANKVKRFYFGDEPVSEDNIVEYVNFFTDVMFAHSMLWATKLHVEAGNNQIYLYEYSFVDEDVPEVSHTNIRGANHCAQSMAILDGKNLTHTSHTDESFATPEFQKMKKTMREIWYNFIKTGKPVPEGSSLPAWPAAGANRSPYMSLDQKIELRGVLLEERSHFWEDIYQKYYREPVPPPTPPSKPRTEL